MKITRLFTCLLFISIWGLQAQKPDQPSSSEILKNIEKLNFLGSVLYIAAHPDDENTALISHLANEVQARTAYLSLTRGDGGQNLIGPEIRELLGVIRTQELLAARSIDGGMQFFTRANDFGYSKNPKETLTIWDEDKVLSDVVRTIRTFKPDIIINRFDHRTPGSTHGHHTSSAMLSVEAFDLANNPNKYSEQLNQISTWQPQRLYFNTSSWFYKSKEAFNKAVNDNLLAIDVGAYYATLGLSNTEISALSRSQHKSQGFGNTGSRGSSIEYLELIKGDEPYGKSIFDGIDTSWNRLRNGEPIGKLIEKIIEEYDLSNPAASIPQLVQAYTLINNLEDSHWKYIKLNEVKELIKDCAGLYLEAVTNTQTATSQTSVKLNIEAINRSQADVKLLTIKVNPTHEQVTVNKSLTYNSKFSKELTFNTQTLSGQTPYWLTQEGSVGMYTVTSKELIGLPETPASLQVDFNVLINGQQFTYTTTPIYKYADRVAGEVYEPFAIVPPISIRMQDDVVIFAEAKTKEVSVTVQAYQNNISGKLSLNAGEGWEISPKAKSFTIDQKGSSKTITFKVTPLDKVDQAQLTPTVSLNGKTYNSEVIQLDYEHIPLQTLVLPTKTKLIRSPIKIRGERIGYINGAGDVIPASLEQIGYQVEVISTSQITPNLLDNYDAIVMGIRAYNVNPALRYKQQALLDYVNNGGTLVVQYNTSRGFNFPNLGPYPLQLSRDRVTDETAAVHFINPEHEILNVPNKLTTKDFEGWVQERGLYFPDKWDNKYTPIFSINDKDESPKKGSLLIAPYGKGHYIYTGLSFFRELPAGVPGAYKLFANLLSIGKNETLN